MYAMWKRMMYFWLHCKLLWGNQVRKDNYNHTTIIEIHQLPYCGNSSNEFANLDVCTNIEDGNVENIAYSLHTLLDLLNGSMRSILFVLYPAGGSKRHGHNQNLANARGRWRTTHCHSLSPLPITADHCHPLPITATTVTTVTIANHYHCLHT